MKHKKNFWADSSNGLEQYSRPEYYFWSNQKCFKDLMFVFASLLFLTSINIHT